MPRTDNFGHSLSNEGRLSRRQPGLAGAEKYASRQLMFLSPVKENGKEEDDEASVF
jgi:hypothetical protein